jgi:hypothetical protein
MLIFRSKFRFQFWDYTTSHSQLLLRSILSDDTKNIDIVFGAVEIINIPIDFLGIEITSNNIQHEIITYKLKCLKKKSLYYIKAGYLRIFENDLDAIYSSLDFSRISSENNLWRKSDKYKILY